MYIYICTFAARSSRTFRLIVHYRFIDAQAGCPTVDLVVFVRFEEKGDGAAEDDTAMVLLEISSQWRWQSVAREVQIEAGASLSALLRS